jgi:hypothetical protein
VGTSSGQRCAVNWHASIRKNDRQVQAATKRNERRSGQPVVRGSRHRRASQCADVKGVPRLTHQRRNDADEE